MPTSIAGRLTLMFAVTTGLVTALAGAAIFMFQTVELKRHQAEELQAGFEIVEAMVAHLSDGAKWPLLADKLKSFTPANDSIRYRVESADPRFTYGAPWPAGAEIKAPREGYGYVRFCAQGASTAGLGHPRTTAEAGHREGHTWPVAAGTSCAAQHCVTHAKR
ncbi:hypothetical protein [Caulobacter hibisci]|uniref:Uncharacterized protein n=1 Tax=Caulobacter hibisci TaxID=2035993 RepID=A0ABS0SXZ0_9CAUL|nr:hypothetical protein [Caulobacter hibisci]MBI1684507.1 hypothetical protein [Caulobacter hibisci]